MALMWLDKKIGQAGFTCAVVLCSTPAFSGEWELGLGAAFEQFAGYVSYDGATSSDFDGVDAVATGQIFIVPSFTADNGLKFGGNFEIEGHLGERNAGVVVDEAALSVQGGFGEIWLGRSDTPGNHMQFGAPDSIGPDVNFVGLSTVPLPSMLQFSNVHSTVRVGDDLLRGTLGSTYVSNMGEDTGLRLSYFTPRIGGFQIGASYAPDGSDSSNNRENFWDIGANYTRRIGGVDTSFSAKYGIAENGLVPGDDPEYWGVGFNLGYGGFSVGGSYAESTGSALGLNDGEAFDIGARYQRGRYGISLNYLSGQNTDDENAGIGAMEQLEAITLSASYALIGEPDDAVQPPGPGAGVDSRYDGQDGMAASIFGFVSFTEFSEDVGDGGVGTPGDDVDGVVIGTGLRLTF